MSFRKLAAWLLIVSGAIVFIIGAMWATQVVFQPSLDTNEGTWTFIGIFIAIVGLLCMSVGSLLLRRRL